MRVSIGRIVHYVDDGGCAAAIVTDIYNDQIIDLWVFDEQIHHQIRVNWNEAHDNGTWHWPERT